MTATISDVTHQIARSIVSRASTAYPTVYPADLCGILADRLEEDGWDVDCIPEYWPPDAALSLPAALRRPQPWIGNLYAMQRVLAHLCGITR